MISSCCRGCQWPVKPLSAVSHAGIATGSLGSRHSRTWCLRLRGGRGSGASRHRSSGSSTVSGFPGFLKVLVDAHVHTDRHGGFPTIWGRRDRGTGSPASVTRWTQRHLSVCLPEPERGGSLPLLPHPPSPHCCSHSISAHNEGTSEAAWTLEPACLGSNPGPAP